MASLIVAFHSQISQQRLGSPDDQLAKRHVEFRVTIIRVRIWANRLSTGQFQYSGEEIMVLDEKSQAEVNRFVRVSQIVVVALGMGIVTFAVAAVFLAGGKEEAEAGMLTLVAVGMTVVCGGVSLLVPHGIVLAQRRRIVDGTWQMQGRHEDAPVTDAGKLAAVYLIKTIVVCGPLEGACFVALVAFMTEGHLVNHIIGALLLFGVLARFPTSDRVTGWVTDQLRLLKEERQIQ